MDLIDSDKPRFQAFLATPNENGCILWLGYTQTNGYGQFRVRETLQYSHRVALVMSGRSLLEGELVLHSCDVPSCCNPGHLWIGSQQDNMLDMKMKRRGTGGRHGLPRGVHETKGGKYIAQLSISGKSRYLGRWETIAAAEKAIQDFERYGQCP